MFLEKGLRLSLTFFITIYLARYLGPEDFGTFNFAISFVALFGIFSTLGLDKLLAKKLLDNPSDEAALMGASFFLRISSGLAMLISALIIAEVLRPDDNEFTFLVLCSASASVFNALEIIKYRFESRVEAKYNSIVEGLVIVLGTLVKIFLIWNEAKLVWFGMAIVFESLLLAFGHAISFKLKTKKIVNWSYSISKIKSLFLETMPFVLAGAIFILLTRIDQIMIGIILDDNAVGIYSAALKLSEGWMFVPALVATSLFPSLIEAKKSNYELYIASVQNLLNIMVAFSVLVAVAITLCSEFLIELLYGASYQGASTILLLNSWAMVFNTISVVSFRYFIIEGLQVYSVYRAAVGLVINIFLNFLLIPKYNIIGAAWATLITQIIAAFLLNAASQKTRPAFLMQFKSILLIGVPETIKFYKKVL